MSNQPKPATDEWTAESVFAIGNDLQAIAGAHNAALAAAIAAAQQPLLDALTKAKPFIRALPGRIDEAKLVMKEVNSALAGGWLSREALDEYAKVEAELAQLAAKLEKAHVRETELICERDYFKKELEAARLLK